MATIFEYNGYTFPDQVRKVLYRRNSQEVVIAFDFTVPTATVASVLATLNAWDKPAQISWATATPTVETWSVTTNAVSIRTNATKEGAVYDGAVRQKITFTATIRLKDIKAGDGGFESYEAQTDISAQGAHILTITGVVTGTNGGNTAVENFDAGIAGIEGIFKTLYSGVYNAAERSTPNNDRHNNILSFRTTLVEVLEVVNFIDGAGAETFDPAILFYRWAMAESVNHNKGHSDPAERLLTVDFSCLFDRAYAQNADQLEAGIAALVIKRMKTQFNLTADPIIVQAVRQFSSTDMSASARWVFRVDQGPVFTSYSEVISDFTVFGSYLKLSNGKPLSIKTFSNGAVMELTQRVTATAQGNAPSDPPVPAIVVRGVTSARLVALTRGRDRGSSEIGDASFGAGSWFSGVDDEHTFEYVQRYVVDAGGNAVITGR